MRRRRLLTGLSAASVAAALPNFALGSRALAQDAPQIISRLEPGEVGSRGREYRLYLKSSRVQTLAQVFRVRESHVLYGEGTRRTLQVFVASSHVFTRRALQRRAPPRLPPLTLDREDEAHVATLSLRATNPRNENGRTQIIMSLAGQLFTLPEVTLMA